MDVTQASNINYGIGGNYLSTIQTGLNPVITPTTTPFPPDSFTPTIFGAAPPPAYLTPPPPAAPTYQVPPQTSYYQKPFNYETASASLTKADEYLDKKRQEAINQGRPDLVAQINQRQDAIEYAQGQVDANKPEETK